MENKREIERAESKNEQMMDSLRYLLIKISHILDQAFPLVLATLPVYNASQPPLNSLRNRTINSLSK